MSSTVRQRSTVNSSLSSSSAYNSGYRRVFNSDDILKRQTRDKLGESVFLWFILLYVLIFGFVRHCDNLLPSPRSSADKTTFSEERARKFLNELSNLGTRPTGSYANEVLAVDYLLKQLRLIQSSVNNASVNKLSIDLQKVEGSFYVDFSDGLTSYYRNVKNVVAKIGPETGPSLLVNCHFDSVPGSPGASDDAVGCAVMLEILWNLAWSKVVLKHSIVFLFNGAEENFLQASHGFITQHVWAKEIVAFINLEACGAGGREVLFQAGPGNEWLVEAYSKGARYPFGSILGQEIFQSGIIPSDTDFRIFRDFGKIPGLDFAYVKNGYVYHTRFDHAQYVIPGSIQHEGENVLGTINEILLHPQFEQRPEIGNTKVVYFDFLGLFLVMYGSWTGYILHGGTVIISLCFFLFKFRDAETLQMDIIELAKAVAAILSSFLVSFVVVMTLASLVSTFGCGMSWFYRSYWVVGLYLCPAVASLLIVHWQVAVRRHNKQQSLLDWQAETLYYNAVRLLWIAITSLMLLGRLYSAFLPATWLLFPVVIRDLSSVMLTKKQNRSHLYYLLPHFAMQIIPMAFTAYCWIQVYSVFLPIMGRIGAHTNPDLIIAGLSTVVAFTSSSYLLPMVQVVRSTKKIVGALVGITILSLFIVCLTPFGFPYSADPSSPTPQRFWIMHTARTHYFIDGSIEKQDSGFWIIPLDYNGLNTLVKHLPELQSASEVDCEAKFYCGVPYYFPVVKKLKKTYFLPSSEPRIYSRKRFELVSQKVVQVDNNIESLIRRLNFRIEGPDHMTVVFCPYPNINLTTWSLGNGSAYTRNKWHERPTYFVYYSHGEHDGPWDIWIELKLPWGLPAQEPVLDVAFHSHFINSDGASEAFVNFLSRMPNWTHPVAWTATYDSYIF